MFISTATKDARVTQKSENSKIKFSVTIFQRLENLPSQEKLMENRLDKSVKLSKLKRNKIQTKQNLDLM